MTICHYIKYCLGFALFLLLQSCKPDIAYYTYEPIPLKGWSKHDTLQFYLPDSLHSGNYLLEVGVRHSGKYPYRDLWLELTHYSPSSNAESKWLEQKDTIHIYLASEKGNWNGNGTTGGHFQLLYPSGNFSFIKNTDSEKNSGEPKMEDNYNQKEKVSGLVTNKSKKKYTFLGKPHSLGKRAEYKLKIVHIMTDSLLLHITDIGLRLTGPVNKDRSMISNTSTIKSH